MRLYGLGTLDPSAAQTIASTIQQVEGYYPGSLAYRNNNPGNLIYAGQPGATQGTNGFAVFDSYADGYQALLNQLNNYASRGMTISSMMAVYAPAAQAGNDPGSYANQIAASLGVDPNAPLTSLGAPVDGSIPDDGSDPTLAADSSSSVDWALVGAVAGVALLGLMLS